MLREENNNKIQTLSISHRTVLDSVVASLSPRYCREVRLFPMKKRKRSSDDGSFDNGNSPRGVAGSSVLHLQQGEHGRHVEAGDAAEDLGQEVEVPLEQGGASPPQQTRKRRRKRTRGKKKSSDNEGGSKEDEDGVGGATETDREASGSQEGGAGGRSGQFVAGIDDTIYVSSLTGIKGASEA